MTEAVARTDSTDRAYRAVLDLIARGDLAGGDRIPEQTVAELASVSRTPVRAALSRLAAQGVVRLSPNRGAEVLDFSVEDARSLFDLRAKLESEASRLAAPRLTAAQVDQMKDLSWRMRELTAAPDVQHAEVGKLNDQFHRILVQNCGNRHLVLSLQSVVVPAAVIRTFSRYSSEALQRSMNHHDELVAAVEAGDPEWAEACMRTHILAGRSAYLQAEAEQVVELA